MPRGTFPSWQRNDASPPCSDRTRTDPPGATPSSFRSSGCRVRVLTIFSYSWLSLPTLICCPCLLVRPAFMMKRIATPTHAGSRQLPRGRASGTAVRFEVDCTGGGSPQQGSWLGRAGRGREAGHRAGRDLLLGQRLPRRPVRLLAPRPRAASLAG